jgi:GntR family transcriptional repressor for pyruvate dehydrogenase complex
MTTTKKQKTATKLPKRDIVAQKLKQLMLDRSLRSGDALPSEQELADQFGVSRICLREATKALSFLGILKPTRRWGTTIGDVDMSRFSEYMGLHFAASGYSLSQLLEARLVVEVGILDAVMRRMDDEPRIYTDLSATVESMNKVLDEPLPAARCDFEFHRAMVIASGNEPLAAFSQVLQTFFHQMMVDRTRRHALGKRQVLSRVLDDHRQIVEALRDQNLPLAQGLMRQHLERHRER